MGTRGGGKPEETGRPADLRGIRSAAPLESGSPSDRQDGQDGQDGQAGAEAGLTGGELKEGKLSGEAARVKCHPSTQPAPPSFCFTLAMAGRVWSGGQCLGWSEDPDSPKAPGVVSRARHGPRRVAWCRVTGVTRRGCEFRGSWIRVKLCVVASPGQQRRWAMALPWGGRMAMTRHPFHLLHVLEVAPPQHHVTASLATVASIRGWWHGGQRAPRQSCARN